MAGVLRADPLWVETFTGLRMRQCEGLLRVVRERGGNGPGGGRPWCLPLADRVLLVAVYYRTNLTMRQLAPLFAVSPATVCRVIQRLRPLLALEPISRPADPTDRLWIVDGTLRGRHAAGSHHQRQRVIKASGCTWSEPRRGGGGHERQTPPLFGSASRPGHRKACA